MQIRCRCGKVIPLSIALVGKRVNCPKCRGPMFPIGTGRLGNQNDFAYRLFIVRGPTHVGVQILLCGDGALKIGRIKGVQILLTGDRVSRTHSVLNPSNDGWQIADTKSSNGTFVNGKRISEPIHLVAGDVVMIGKYEMVYETMRIPADQPPVKVVPPPLLDQLPISADEIVEVELEEVDETEGIIILDDEPETPEREK